MLLKTLPDAPLAESKMVWQICCYFMKVQKTPKKGQLEGVSLEGVSWARSKTGQVIS